MQEVYQPPPKEERRQWAFIHGQNWNVIVPPFKVDLCATESCNNVRAIQFDDSKYCTVCHRYRYRYQWESRHKCVPVRGSYDFFDDKINQAVESAKHSIVGEMAIEGKLNHYRPFDRILSVDSFWRGDGEYKQLYVNVVVSVLVNVMDNVFSSGIDSYEEMVVNGGSEINNE